MMIVGRAAAQIRHDDDDDDDDENSEMSIITYHTLRFLNQ